jgi:uncharacterized protein YecE (DUF72 family)
MRCILIGTSGWSYPRGQGKWTGVFYPKVVKGKGELEFYSRYFDTVEVNSTFYRPASPIASKGWADRTPEGFQFTAKAWQKFTHPNMFEDMAGKDSSLRQKDYDEFKIGIDPLMEAGKFGCLLFQFPPSFKADGPSREKLEGFLVRFREYPLAVEFRHHSWSDREDEIRDTLDSLSVAWAYIDEPKFATSIRQTLPEKSRRAYLRFHGRNREKWWDRNAGEQRYNYLYSQEELFPYAEFLNDRKDAPATTTYVFFNNHYGGNAVANALQLRMQLGEEISTDLPEGFSQKFSFFENFSEARELSLFQSPRKSPSDPT